MFRLNFDDFSGPGTTGAEKVENGTHMTRFSARNISTIFGVQFLSFRIETARKCLGQILTTFPGLAPSEQEKLKTGPDDSDLTPEMYAQYLGLMSYRFPSLRLKMGSDRFSRLFQDRAQPAWKS